MRVMHFSPAWRANRSERVQRRRASWLAGLAILAAALLWCVLPQAASAESALNTGLGASTEPGASAEPEVSLTPSTTKPYTLCPPGGPMIECNLIIDPPPVETSAGLALPGGGPLLEGGGEKGGFDPENLQSAYKLPTSGGSEETVALVDAYGYKSAESDLAKYREKYKLSACTKASGCFKQVNEKGEEKNYPAEGGGLEVEWSLETSLDMDMVSAACPNCKIMLVEATTQGPSDTGASAEEAAKLKANEISNSYGYPENNETWCPSKNGCKEYLSDYNHAGIPVTVSSGDSGYDDGVGAPSWPATSPNVIAVGGTSLKKAENARGWSETVWSGSGSGCSLYESKPAWQKDKGCTKRTDNDIAAVASPSTPVSVYNTPYAGGWINVGGTSVSSPLVAGVEAHANSTTKSAAAEAFYKKPSMLFHVSEGSNGSCGTEAEATYYLCHATKEGYNGPTGEGTPDGVFSVSGPSAITGSATSITKTGATLNGTVNPNGVETKYYFEYGETTSYGNKTAEASAGSGTSNVEESKAITGLTTGKQYDFRIVATNSSKETSEGANQVFTTTSKPLVETKEATSIGKTTATLNGIVNPHGEETKYYFEYGLEKEKYEHTTAEASAGAGTSNVEVSKSITGLAPETTYYVRIVATNGAGTSDGNEKTFKTTVGEWSLREPLNVSKATHNEMLGVSCPSATFCIAVGRYETATASGVVAEKWNGTEWTKQEPVQPAKAEIPDLSSVSCTSSTACIAVGYYRAEKGAIEMLAEQWNGTEWKIVETSAFSSGELDEVSCTSATTCMVVGAKSSKGFAARWNGTEWKVLEVSNHSGAKASILHSVSCASAEECTVIELYYIEKEPWLYEIQRWNGTTWKIEEIPSPKEVEEYSLHKVSCPPSSTACIAVGYSKNKEHAKAWTVRWTGTEWKYEEPPRGTWEDSGLAGISCTAASECIAVGSGTKSDTESNRTLAERWNGTEWKMLEPINPSGEKGVELYAASCTSSLTCMAVGYVGGGENTYLALGDLYE
jgi:hypothetical protein